MGNKGLKIIVASLSVVFIAGLVCAIAFNDYFAYNKSVKKNTVEAYSQFLNEHPDSEYCDEAQKRLENMEDVYYKHVLSVNTMECYNQYIHIYPKGKHINEVLSHKETIQEQTDYKNAIALGSANSYRQYLDKHPHGQHRYEIEEKLDELEAFDYYKNNSLSNGSQPYSYYYGYNRSCDYYGCSEICVKAPYSSDVLVLIKRNNSNGSVIRHGYVCAGQTVCFEVPDGRYQTFFYYGKGWYPDKKMKNGVRGGFLRDEVFSKDNPQNLSNQSLTYELVLQKNGNFSTKSSSESEMF